MLHCVHDTAPRATLDPTGTTQTRRRVERELVRRLDGVRRQINSAVGKSDVLGLGASDPMRAMQSAMFSRLFSSAPTLSHSSPGEKVSGFQGWLAQTLSAALDGDWQDDYVRAAYAKGAQDSAELTGSLSSLDVALHRDRLGLVLVRARNDVAVLAQAVLQSAVRELTQGLTETGLTPSAMARRVSRPVIKVGLPRARTHARVIAVAAHAEGSLSEYEVAGVERVTGVAERVPRTRVGDSYDPKQPRDPGGEGGGQWISEGSEPSETVREVIKKATQGSGLTSARLSENQQKELTTWLKKQPKSDVEVHRGIWLTNKQFAEGDWTVGSTKSFAALSSFTEDPIRAAAYGTGGDIFVLMTLPRGRAVDISKHSVYPQEQEHVLSTALQTKVVSRERASPGFYKLRLGDQLRDAPPVLSARVGVRGQAVRAKHPAGQKFRTSGLRSGGGARGKVAFETMGDEDVCPECEALEGSVYTVAQARGVIPVHPNCRCRWVPA